MAEPGRTDNPPLETVVQDLGDELKRLVRAEMELAQREMAGQLRELGLTAGMAGGAGLLGLLSAGTGTAALVLALARRPHPWLAALTVSGAYAGGALLLAREARRRIAESGVPVPERTIDTLKDTAQRVGSAATGSPGESGDART